MAIDTAAKRRNVGRIMFPILLMGLSPSSGLDTDDRENAAGAYIGLTYEETPAAAVWVHSRTGIGMGVGIGLCLLFLLRSLP